MKWRQYSRNACRKFCLSPESKYPGSAGPPYSSPPLSTVPPCTSLMLCLWPSSPHGARCKYFGVVAHVRGGEGLSCKVDDPIMELVLTLRDEATHIVVQGMAAPSDHFWL